MTLGRVLRMGLSAMVASVAGGNAFGQSIMVDYDAPALDRWMYPFNFTPGTRSSASTFGALGEPDFDNRDGQFIVGWDTGGDVPTGLGAQSYTVESAVVRLATDQGGFAYDESQDSYVTLLPETDPAFVADSDAGRPVTLFGLGYRNGFDSASFAENSPFGPNAMTNRSVRNAFATDFVSGVAVDVSNSVDEGFDPAPFAIGLAGIAPGTVTPADTEFVFDLNVADPDVQAYLAQAMDSGRLRLVVTSLHPAVQQGGEFASWYTKENLFGAGRRARLSLTVRIGDPADLTGDGVVDGMDLATLLAGWGGSGVADLNNDGVVDGEDLAALLAAWTV